ncbi:MAG: 2-C-methyl-D-erythritol 4-phosphate cytidylyltransferase [Chitinispirillaceae bacterium]|nr:2-C-methyl-D-erythritol 4-phosphate cytidylyltransferase [Chitinispirillaceae bacterium]
MEQCDAVIVAAGSGTRLGVTIPKAFVPLGGKPLLAHSLETFIAYPEIDRIVLVVPAGLVDRAVDTFADDKVAVVAGGAERWESVRNGCLASDAPWVLVHDAARPFVTASVIDALLVMRNRFDCAFTATPVVDTIRTFTGDTAGKTVDRSKLVRVGTPQLFRSSLLPKCFDLAATLPSPPTDEVFLMQQIGIPAGIARGDPKNFKITTKEDLEIAEGMLRLGMK